MKRKKIAQYRHKNNDHTRDFWIEENRHTHVSYIGKNKKKIIPRKRKYGGIYD